MCWWVVQQIVLVLQRDQPGLQRPQHQDRAAQDQRRPQHEMHPDRRREFDLDDRREANDDEPEKQDHEHRRTIAGILRRQIEAAGRTARADVQQAGEQASLAAARTAAGKGRMGQRYRRELASLSRVHPPWLAGTALPMPHQ